MLPGQRVRFRSSVDPAFDILSVYCLTLSEFDVLLFHITHFIKILVIRHAVTRNSSTVDVVCDYILNSI